MHNNEFVANNQSNGLANVLQDILSIQEEIETIPDISSSSNGSFRDEIDDIANCMNKHVIGDISSESLAGITDIE
ncbi:MAG: hypothetical protein AB8B67_04470 [Rickettsiaceae bacterium]